MKNLLLNNKHWILLFCITLAISSLYTNCAPAKFESGAGSENLSSQSIGDIHTSTDPDSANYTGNYTGGEALPQGACLFNGQSVANGASVTAYAASAVAYGQTCASETRVCNNGVLSGSNQYASCAVGQPASCLFNGQTIANGAYVDAFLKSTVSGSETCQSEKRLCNNGVLSGSNQYSSCAVVVTYQWIYYGLDHVDGCSVCQFKNCEDVVCTASIVGYKKACHIAGTKDNSNVYICAKQ